MFYAHTHLFSSIFSLVSPTKYEWHVWISGFLVPCVCAILLCCGSSVSTGFCNRETFDQQTTFCWVGLESGWAVQTASALWMGRQIAMCGSWAGNFVSLEESPCAAAQDFTQSKMMHSAVGNAKTETGRRVVWAQVSVGGCMLYTVHLCMCVCVMVYWDCTWLYCGIAIVFLFVSVNYILHLFGGALELWRWHWHFRPHCNWIICIFTPWSHFAYSVTFQSPSILSSTRRPTALQLLIQAPDDQTARVCSLIVPLKTSV